jgi:hypothetical protein
MGSALMSIDFEHIGVTLYFTFYLYSSVARRCSDVCCQLRGKGGKFVILSMINNYMYLYTRRSSSHG